MPELPEVEIVVRGLNRLILNKQISKAQTDTAKSFPNSISDVEEFLIGSVISGVRRRAKIIIIDLGSGWSLITHLKMTGQMVYRGEENWGAGHPSDDFLAVLPNKSTRVEIEFTDASKLFFNDQRKFGWMKLLPTPEVEFLPSIAKIGPEPLEKDFTFDSFVSRFSNKKRSIIKATILDQSVLAGVGNIYADESLWAAKIHPLTRVGALDDQSFGRLYEAIIGIMRFSIAKGGSTARNYVHADGTKGNYLDFASVYGKAGQNCSRCGSEIIKIKVAGRGTHICPICQKIVNEQR